MHIPYLHVAQQGPGQLSVIKETSMSVAELLNVHTKRDGNLTVVPVRLSPGQPNQILGTVQSDELSLPVLISPHPWYQGTSHLRQQKHRDKKKMKPSGGLDMGSSCSAKLVSEEETSAAS